MPSARGRRSPPTSRPRLELDLSPRARRAIELALPVAGVAYLCAFLARLAHGVAGLYANADVASGPVIAHLLGAAPSGTHVVLGNYPWYEALWLQVGLDGLPGRRALLEGAPFALAALAVAALAWATVRATGSRWAGAVAAVLAGASGPDAWRILGTWTVHGLTWVHTALLGAFAVWLARGPGRARQVAVGIPLGLVSGVAAASDPLLGLAGIVPLAAAWAAALRRAGSTAGTLACVVAAAVAAVAMRAGMDAASVQSAGTLPIRLSLAGFPHHVGTEVGALGNLLGVGVVGLPVGAWATRRALRARDAAARTHAAFWVSGAVLLLAAVALTTVARDVSVSRYLAGVLLATAALVPLAASGRDARVLVAGGAALYALTGLIPIASGRLGDDPFHAPSAGEARALAGLARRERVAVAYGGYWSAMPLTWRGDFALPVYPVQTCPRGGGLCPFGFHRISSWYRPRPHARSLLVVDRRIAALSVRDAPPGLGRPLLRRRVGGLLVVVYGDDVAARFGPPSSAPARNRT